MFQKLFSPKTDPLAVGTVPGTRSVNNLPLIIGGTLLVLFLSIIGYVMMQRSGQAAKDNEKTQLQKGSNASRLAADVTGAWGAGGLVPPEDFEVPPATVEEPKTQEARPSHKPDLNAPPVLPKGPPPVVMTEEQIQVRNMRLQALQAGLRAKTGVQTTDFSSVASVRSREQESTRQPQAGGNDAAASYQARISQLRGAGSANTTNSFASAGENTRPDNGLNKFSRSNRWDLQQKVEAPASAYVLRAGFVIPAIMFSGINSNLPGQVMAQISQNVYDTPTGKYLLIPQGTRLIGTYNSDVGYGQERILMAWQRLVFPDGKALDIEAMPGADSAGMAGFEDQINNHYIRTFSSAFLLSGVIAGVSMSQQQSSGNSNSDRQRAGDAMSEALGQTLGTTMAEMIKKNLNIAPTLEIRPGYRFNVMVTKDITFEGPYAAFDY